MRILFPVRYPSTSSGRTGEVSRRTGLEQSCDENSFPRSLYFDKLSTNGFYIIPVRGDASSSSAVNARLPVEASAKSGR
ncbi:MAG TPA: hypothetical protein VKR54_02940, partial [Candidatus Babeliales bacterium]|nr:hypothetical protein [Candidatus Babeliales bacterium]